jgi:solute carrier family 25 phosphate transporter 23/24/25/41
MLTRPNCSSIPAKILQQASTATHAIPLGLTPGSGRSLWATLLFMIRSPEPMTQRFWKGNTLNCLRVVPGNALRYFGFDFFQRFYPVVPPDAPQKARILKRVVCSSLAATTSTILTYPLDFVRLRWTVQTPHLDAHNLHYRDILTAVKAIFREEGTGIFFRGCLISIFGIVPYVTTNFTLYGTLRDYLLHSSGDSSLSTLQSVLLGGLSGALAMTLTFPLEPIHTRLIMEGYRQKLPTPPTVRGTARAIYQAEGFHGFFRGMLPAYLKVVPAQAISWTVVELCARWFG